MKSQLWLSFSVLIVLFSRLLICRAGILQQTRSPDLSWATHNALYDSQWFDENSTFFENLKSAPTPMTSVADTQEAEDQNYVETFKGVQEKTSGNRHDSALKRPACWPGWRFRRHLSCIYFLLELAQKYFLNWGNPPSKGS